jgi:hypothetical protein
MKIDSDSASNGALEVLLRKEFLGCRAGAATESRPYRLLIVVGGASFAMMDYKHSAPLELGEEMESMCAPNVRLRWSRGGPTTSGRKFRYIGFYEHTGSKEPATAVGGDLWVGRR